jgi:hypothetical protein
MLRTTVLAIILAVGVTFAVLTLPPLYWKYRARSYMPAVHALVSAGARGDSAAIAHASADASLWLIIKERPRLRRFFLQATDGLRPFSVNHHGDTVVVESWLRHPYLTVECGALGYLRARVVSTSAGWRVAAFDTGIC